MTIISTPVAGVSELLIDNKKSFRFYLSSISECILEHVNFYRNRKIKDIYSNIEICRMAIKRRKIAMKCPLCGENGKEIFKGRLLKKYLVQYYQCCICGLVFTETPYWIDEAYEDTITCFDTGIMSRNIRNMFCTNVLIDKQFDKNSIFLDYGGGYGIFTRIMRDLGYDFRWKDKYSPNLFARGFEFEDKESIDLLTAFELFEHFSEPKEELDYLFGVSDNILFSTLLYDNNMRYKPFSKWWYYTPQTGQHIVFYSKRTCLFIAQKYKVNYYCLGDDLHLFTKSKLDDKFIKLYFKSNYSWILQYYFYRKNSKFNKCVIDMRKLIKKTNCN